MRLPAATPSNVRRLTLANLIANIGIIITGGAVRLTGSGLGCAQWPTCNEGNVFPTPEMPVHTYVEFINRTFTFILVVIALLTWLVVRRMVPARPDLTRLAFLVGLGIPAQAVLGGITVLTGLNPYTVMGHLMISMVLVYWATLAHHRAQHLDRPVTPYRNAGMHWLARLLMFATYLTLAIGTFVTGSGPHGGDPEAGRTGFDPELISQLHADAVFLLVGVTVAILAMAFALDTSAGLRKAVITLLVVEATQSVIGYVQYFTDLPVVLVGFHLLGAALIMWAATRVYEELRYVAPRLRSHAPDRELELAA